jgi:hypothetical protein
MLYGGEWLASDLAALTPEINDPGTLRFVIFSIRLHNESYTHQYFVFCFSTWFSFVAGGKSRTSFTVITSTRIGNASGGFVSAIFNITCNVFVFLFDSLHYSIAFIRILRDLIFHAP